MSFDIYVIKAVKALIHIELIAVFIGSLLSGAFLAVGLSTDQEKMHSKVFLALSAGLSFFGPGAWFIVNYMVADKNGLPGLPGWHLFVWFLLFFGALVTSIALIRRFTPKFEELLHRLTVRTSLERNKKVDVRSIEQFLPKQQEEYDPKKYFQKGNYFLGLGESGEPVYWESALPHVQVAGTTGSGKGVFIGMIEAQAVTQGAALFAIDPKDDEWGAHVVYDAAVTAGVDYHYVDLRPGAGPQINFFDGASRDEIEELFLAGFGLSDKGGAEDFYRIADRKAAKDCADIAGEGGYTPARLYNEWGVVLEKNAAYFAGLLREMAELNSVNAVNGLNLSKVVEDGGAVYVVGSMRNAKVVRMQRMLLVRLIQMAERRDRSGSKKPRPIVAVLDELKYHISRPALEALGAARDKGLHVVMAHQSLADLKDCPADLNGDAVTGAVLENGRLKLVYKVEDPDTCEWLARKSGKIQVDDESRQVIKSLAQVEKLEAGRTIRQSQRYFVDEDVIGNLPRGVGVVFGVGLPQFVRTSPMKVQKRAEALETTVVAGDQVEGAAELIDVEAGQGSKPSPDASDLI